MTRRISVRAVVMRDGKLLCVRLKDYSGAMISAEWLCLPGGGLDDGEGIIEGTIREMVEETGVKPAVGNLLYIHQFVMPKTDTEHLEFFFHVKNAEDYLHIDLSKTTHGTDEIAEIKFVEPTDTLILPKFLTTEDIPAKIKSDNAPTIFSFPK